LFTWSVCVCNCFIIICVEEILGIQHGTLLRGGDGWNSDCTLRNLYKVGETCSIHEIKEQLEFLSGKLKMRNALENWP